MNDSLSFTLSMLCGFVALVAACVGLALLCQWACTCHGHYTVISGAGTFHVVEVTCESHDHISTIGEDGLPRDFYGTFTITKNAE